MVRGQHMKNPLTKRLLRELKEDFGKYAVIFLLLVFSIGLISGFLVADGSMIKAYNDGFEKYQIENGHFITEQKMNQAQKAKIEENGVTLYDQFYVQEEIDFGARLRIYADREQVNTVCLMEGQLPQQDNEIGIDRMFAENNGISVGDTVQADGDTWTVTGLVALPDYSCLFENNNDAMFDAKLFGVAIVSPEAFARFEKEQLHYDYAWKYDTEPATDAEEKEVSEDLMETVNGVVSLKDFLPRYENQAIQFTGEDMGSDRAMMIVLLYIIIVILAFVFAVTTANTIEKEANVIGTLRASGYTRGELIRHYMEMPVIVTLISAVIGNIFGYTVMKNVCAGMYYGSYSLPTYVTVWNAEAFLYTTVVPVLLMLLINVLILYRQMKLGPLQFLRRDLSRKKNRRAVGLSPAIRFFSRFRIRVVLQNMANYVILFIGISFASILLLFGLSMVPIMDHYQEEITGNMIAEYQYMLNMPVSEMDSKYKLKGMLSLLKFAKEVETDNPDAEKFSAYTLRTMDENYMLEDILFYGIEPDSRYVSLKLSDDDVVISSAYASKFGLSIGDSITLKEKYEDKTYTFTVTQIYPYEASLVVFLSRDHLNDVFDLGKDMYGGYFSSSEITDIDDKYIGSVIDLDALTKMTRQMEISMGGMMWLVSFFAVLIFAVLVYLLSKIIIEKNAQSISMAKILGYSKGEIARLYVMPTSIVVVLCVLINIPLSVRIIGIIWKAMLSQMMTGYLPYWIDPKIYVEMFVAGVICYGVVAALELKRIGKVPMDMALKNVE